MLWLLVIKVHILSVTFKLLAISLFSWLTILPPEYGVNSGSDHTGWSYVPPTVRPSLSSRQFLPQSEGRASSWVVHLSLQEYISYHKQMSADLMRVLLQVAEGIVSEIVIWPLLSVSTATNHMYTSGVTTGGQPGGLTRLVGLFHSFADVPDWPWHGFIHRDLSTRAVLIGDRLNVKVSDLVTVFIHITCILANY